MLATTTNRTLVNRFQEVPRRQSLGFMSGREAEGTESTAVGESPTTCRDEQGIRLSDPQWRSVQNRPYIKPGEASEAAPALRFGSVSNYRSQLEP